MKTNLLIAALLGTAVMHSQPPAENYTNPVLRINAADPTIIRAMDGHFYLFSTEHGGETPVYRSEDLVNWQHAGAAFTRGDGPDGFDPEGNWPSWNPKGSIWAPDINYIDGRYVLYYSKSVWGGEWEAGVGVATSRNPQGPFTDHGSLIIGKEIGIQNCIDPFYILANGKNYLFWGSFHGIYGIELSKNGLHFAVGAKPVKVAGGFMEGTYILRRNGYYYLFGSTGSCCEGVKSTYRVTVGRSKDILGPYVDKQGRPLLDDNYEVILRGNRKVFGPGHNAEVLTDDLGQDWMAYHGYTAENPKAGRQVFLDRMNWRDGWPYFENSEPSDSSDTPYFGQIHLADPTVFYDDGTYYLYGTAREDGFIVYTSTDLKHWIGPLGVTDGKALARGDAFGSKGFWAPQVVKRKGKYHIFYTADEQLAKATADTPLGPFINESKASIPAEMKQIDPFVFTDTDGKSYLYHVRLTDGNRIYVAQLNDDMTAMEPGTERECIHANKSGWENAGKAKWTVSEGPTVVKVGDTYYMFYSANDYRHPGYAVGLATSKSPLGPWKKESHPIIDSKMVGINGTGHGDLFHDRHGNWQYIMHVHNSNDAPSPRRTAIIQLEYDGKTFHADPSTFRLITR